MGRPRKTWQPATTAADRQVVRVLAYVRVSTAEQATDGYGLDAQRQAIAAYCAAAGYELVDMFSDEGLSGTLPPAERPGLAALLVAVDADDVDGVVVKALDRVGRSLRVAAEVFARLDAAGVRFISISEPELASDLLRGLFSGIASDERRRILERTSSGRQVKASNGGYAGGRVPFGYRLVGARKDARWTVEPDEAATVRRIFAERAAGVTFATIAKRLNDDGIAGPRGGVWHPSAVCHIANNVVYAGLRRWREGKEYRVRGEYEPIVAGVA